MREIVRKSQFKKDFKRLRSTGRNLAILAEVIIKLHKNEELPQSLRDHSLIGNYSGFGEFHMGGDVLVIYCIEDDIRERG